MPTIAIGVKHVTLGEGTEIGLLNVFRGLRRIELEDSARIESWNWVSAHPIYQQLDDNAGTLFVGYGSKIGSRCYIDCSGTVIVREYAALGGHRCLLQTHEPDLAHHQQTVGRITVGDHSLVSSCTVLLQGAFVPARSVVGAHSTVLAGYDDESAAGLYVGSPAKWKCASSGGWHDREYVDITQHGVRAEQGILSGDRSATRQSRQADKVAAEA